MITREEKIEKLSELHESIDTEKEEERRASDKIKNDRLTEQKIQDMEQDRKERRLYALLSFILICIFLITVLVFTAISQRLGLSDPVIITLLTSSMATVFGIFLCVMRYLFRKA